MNFTQPLWLAVGALACLGLLGLWHRDDVRRQAALARFISTHLRAALTQSVSIGRRRIRRGLFLMATALLCVALAGPQWGFRWEKVSSRGNEIVFAVDVSRSMSTPDVKPDRLTRAKLAMDDFAKQLDGDAVGLVAFAGEAFLACPITLDYGAFHETMNALDTNTIPRPGTNIASAIREAQAALHRRPGSDRILILVTDGEDLEGDAVAAAEAAAKEDSLRIYTVGVGTANGDLIPLSTGPHAGFVKDASGAFVKSRLDETALKAIAVATGGFYVPLGLQGEGLDTLYKSVLGPLAKHDLASRQQKIYTERYQWPLGAALALLLASLGVGDRRRSTAKARSGAAGAAGATGAVGAVGAAAQAVAAAVTLMLPLLLALVPAPSLRAAPVMPGVAAPGAVTTGVVAPGAVAPSADTADAAARAAASATPGAPAPPASLADDPKRTVQQYNAGTAAYKAGQFPQAAQAFLDSISHAPSGDPQRLADQEDAYYNLGNTLYRTGQKTAQSAPDTTLKHWNDAVKAYETALQLRPDDADSKFNRDFVKRKIDELKQQQSQQKQSNNQSQDQSKKQQQNSQSGQQKAQNDQKGQQPPQPNGGDPQSGQQPAPPTAGQKPPESKTQPQPQGAPKDGAQPPKPDAGTPDQQADADTREADNQHAPGQMSREEARELLDSVKGEEHHATGVPFAQRSPDEPPPDQPVKDW